MGQDSKIACVIGSGQIIKIYMAFDDCMKMEAMVDLQWTAIQIATMAGAAGDPDFFDQEDSPYFKLKVEMWLGDRASKRAHMRKRETSS